MDVNQQIYNTGSNISYYFIKICLMACFFSFLGIGDTSSMDEEEDHPNHSLVSAKKTGPSSGELTPLVASINIERGESHLYSFIQKYLVQQEEIPESKPKKVLRFSGRGLAIVLGSLAGIPFFEVAKEAGGGNGILGWGVGITNAIATSGTGAWATFNLLQGLNPQSEEERILLQDSRLPIPGHIAAHGLGLVVAVPTAYMAARFNTHKWFAGISYLLDYSLKTSGYLNFFKKVSAQKSKIRSSLGIGDQESTEVDPSLQKIQKFLIQHLSHKVIPALLTMSSEERDHFIELIYQEDNLKAEQYLDFLFNVCSLSSSDRQTPDTWKKGYPKVALISGLSISAVLNLFHNGICGYEAWQMVYDNSAFTIPMAALSTIPIFILEMQATIETGRLLYDATFYRIYGEPQPSLLHTLYPKLSRVIPFVCIPLAAVTAYVGRFMVVDILKEVLPQEGPRLFFAIGGFMGPFLFAAYANYSVIQDLLLSYMGSFGKTSEKNLVLLIQNIEKLSKIIGLTKKEEIQSFIDHSNIQNLISSINNGETREEVSLNQETRSRDVSNNNCGVM
jgi:hypothetical protein